jgi:PII-like signaling protein
MHHIPENALRLRILLGESDRWENQPTYEAIVLAARAAGLAGATVLHGPMGFGAGSRVHTAKILQLSADLPYVVEIVDEDAKIDAFLPQVEAMLTGGGLITIENVRVIHYRPRSAKA